MRIILLFTGDTFLSVNSDRNCLSNSPFSASIVDLFRASNNVCVNLETTVGTGGVKVAKAYNFQAFPDSLKYLTQNRVNVCSLANNHSLDFGEDGLKQTIRYLKEEGIGFIGTEECNRKDIIASGKKVRICSYYGNQKGIARINKQEILNDIYHHKSEVDYVFVCLHWGEEYVAYPSLEQQQMAHAFVDAGANAVIGHHPHVMQGYEEYHGGYIFYSLGNFNFFVDHPYAKKLVETTKAYCVGFEINDAGDIQYQIIPININDNWQPEVITDENEKSRFHNYIELISNPLETGITNSFYLTEVAPHYFKNHLPSWKKRVKNYGLGHLGEMVKWLIHPITYKYYAGMIMSLFHKTVRY